ncbi:MAG TPA: tRNA lysidine(34) synthetase TilS [Stellaceae bacterium]
MTAPRDPDPPVAAEEFAAALAALGPFERAPRLAVAVSGGPDSMALLHLAREWVTAHGGAIAALTVDHGLRPEAAAEAARVGEWCAALGVDHAILRWAGPRPAGDIQAAARAARYRLLEEWCAATATFHLLLAHHREDQAETFLLRLARGSGLDGLAAMSPIVERPGCRLLRPLLALPRARLRASLAVRGQAWVQDPSNDNAAYARIRLRQAAPLLAREGLSAIRLAATARRLARARQVIEWRLARLLARCAIPDPAGFVRLDPGPLLAASDEVGLRALAAVLTAVGGSDYPPRLERLERLHAALRAGAPRARTLGGCRLVPHRGALLVCREPVAMAPPVAVEPGRTVIWDGRFRATVPAGEAAGLTLGPHAIVKISATARTVPAAARAGVAALFDGQGLAMVPALRFCRDGVAPAGVTGEAILLRSTRPATGAGIKVV